MAAHAQVSVQSFLSKCQLTALQAHDHKSLKLRDEPLFFWRGGRDEKFEKKLFAELGTPK